MKVLQVQVSENAEVVVGGRGPLLIECVGEREEMVFEWSKEAEFIFQASCTN